MLLFLHTSRYAEANARLNNRDIFGRFVLEWIASSSAQLSLRCRRLEQGGAAGQHGWQEFASDGERAAGPCVPAGFPCPALVPARSLHASSTSTLAGRFPCLPAGKNKVAGLVEDMLNAVQSEMGRYQRIITYWPMSVDG